MMSLATLPVGTKAPCEMAVLTSVWLAATSDLASAATLIAPTEVGVLAPMLRVMDLSIE